MKIETRREAPNVIVSDVDLTDREEAVFLLRSDAHHDAVHSDQELEEKHLREALDRGAWICDIGDLFDCMQGRYDKRADRESLREEYRTGPYLDRLVEVAEKRYRPFAQRWLLMSPGNHETSVAKHNDTHLTERLYALLKPNAPLLQLGTYAGFLRIRISDGGYRIGNYTIAWHHGHGGSAPVTRGVIQTNRMAIAYPDADLVWSGHTHTDFYLSIARIRINASDATGRDEQIHLRSPGYKDDVSSGEGWAVEKGFMPQSKGAWWLRLWIERTHRTKRIKASVEPAR